MRTTTARWFEVAVKYDAALDTGKRVKKHEVLTIAALTFGGAEQEAIRHAMALCSGDLTVANVNPAAYGEVFLSDKNDEGRWFKAKLAFITLDEKSGKERKTTATYLVQGKDIPSAIRNIDEVFAPTMMDYYIVSLADTNIVDVEEP